MNMPFGKYKGRPLRDIPEDYLAWLLDNCELKPTLRQAVTAALNLNCERPQTSLTTEVVGQWYRRMAMEFHPDRRGSHESMKVINRGHEVLLELVQV